MFKTSTYFIKGQFPQLTANKLISIYKQKLEGQNVKNITVQERTINFNNPVLQFTLSRFNNKFSNFSKGKITITDEADKFIVDLNADITKSFSFPAVLALIAVLLSGIELFSLIIGAAVFILLTVIGLISTYVSFPVYFTNLRNDIEREIRI
jgi:hypothetical protein